MSAWEHIKNSSPAERNRAHQSVQRALKTGQIQRPNACEKCGATPGHTADGRPLIHAHHHDYKKRLDIEWLCASCHRKEHRLTGALNGIHKAVPSGEKNGNARISLKQAFDIYNSQSSARSLARIYGISPTAVRDIKSGRTWADPIRKYEAQQEVQHDK